MSLRPPPDRDANGNGRPLTASEKVARIVMITLVVVVTLVLLIGTCVRWAT